ncbi:MAG: hypothetical protein M1834_005560 [Cirrosporium novae-zelandiae]|nr:MAG: hypothetical protein M1834_005560 [Cirrosporium novae-zelandiae]
MLFQSKLEKLPAPSTDVFDYIFHQGRRDYPRDRVLYRVDETGEELTLEELEEKSRKLADVLVDTYGIHPGDVIAIFASDGLDYPVANFAALAAGATVAPIPVQKDCNSHDIASRLIQGHVQVLFTDREMFAIAEAAAELAGGVPLVSLDDADPYIPQVADLVLQTPRKLCEFHLNSHVQAESYNAFVNRTSGSTGKMKSVLTTHAHFIAVLDATRATVNPNTDPDNDVWLATLSLGYFICGKLYMALNVILGIPVVLMRRDFDQTTLSVIPKHKITFLFITPPLAAKLAKATHSPIDVSSIKWLLSAGAPMHEKLRSSIEQQFNGCHMTLELGTTETLLLAIHTDEKSWIPGSSGELVPGIEAKVRDIDTDELLGPNEEGEILVRNSLARYSGYKDDAIANQDFDAEGFFHTGDVGYLDENRNIFIKDRLKELLRVGDGYGSRISASDLEAVLFDHHAVSAAVVVGIRDEGIQIDQPTAFVVLQEKYKNKAGESLAKEIEDYAGRSLTGLRRLSGGVFFLERFPTVGFKINRRKLKQLVKIEYGERKCSRIVEWEQPQEKKEDENKPTVETIETIESVEVAHEEVKKVGVSKTNNTVIETREVGVQMEHMPQAVAV